MLTDILTGIILFAVIAPVAISLIYLIDTLLYFNRSRDIQRRATEAMARLDEYGDRRHCGCESQREPYSKFRRYTKRCQAHQLMNEIAGG